MLDFNTIDGKKLRVTELNWLEAKPLVQKADAKLVAIIDKIAESCDVINLPLYKVTYPFGARIIDKDKLYFATVDGEEIECDNQLIPKELLKNLQYMHVSEMPIALVLNKNSELYVTVDGRDYPIKVVSKGDILGLDYILSTIEPNLHTDSSLLDKSAGKFVSGIRSTFMLPKISDIVCHKSLKITHDVKQDCPQSFEEHWLVFKDIARAQRSEWQSEFIFFSNEWIKQISNPIWMELANYFMAKGLTKLALYNTIESFNMKLGHLDCKYNVKFSSNVPCLAKHLFNIAVGGALCFKPAINEDSMPIKLIQSAYINGYGLTEYCPIIMELTYINLDNKESGYYFQNYPMSPHLEFAVGIKKKSFVDLNKDVQFVLNMYQRNLAGHSLSKNSLLGYMSRIIEFCYFHQEVASRSKEMKKIEEVFMEDNRFWYNQIGEFPVHSPMLSGCIKISYKAFA